jgi:hypothetical protein
MSLASIFKTASLCAGACWQLAGAGAGAGAAAGSQASVTVASATEADADTAPEPSDAAASLAGRLSPPITRAAATVARTCSATTCHAKDSGAEDPSVSS